MTTADNMQVETDVSYWAGVFDFKGSIRMRTVHTEAKPVSTPYIVIRSRSKEMLLPIQALFGGNIRYGISDRTYTWDKTACGAREIVAKLYPYMKNHQAVIAEILAWRPSKRYKAAIFKPVIRQVSFKQRGDIQ